MTSVFLLANAVRYGRQPDVATWVGAARAKSAFLAAALDHEPTARFLIREGLVSSAAGIDPRTRLKAVSARADRQTLLAIAALLLEVDPPPWLPIAVVDRQVHYEVIPSADMEALEWLRPDLEQLLLNAAPPKAPHTDTLALGIGRAAELAVFAALTGGDGSAIHVSAISDRFGYDVESAHGTGVRRWEVKGCTEVTASAFHLSRNEFEKCRAFASEWTLVQVEFAGAALVAEYVTADHISSIRELPSAEVVSLVPPDTDHFQWEKSALVSPSPRAWVPSSIRIPASLRLPSIYTLGLEALELYESDLADRSVLSAAEPFRGTRIGATTASAGSPASAV
ncbi:DUF3883 domain-containing protein [Agromyces sp. NPDC049794]|uniref:protein NO VEIN domain-containing protein n=1 Tax=unclassified Agromyces TaxID=2639701 RepID=UPI0033EA42F4